MVFHRVALLNHNAKNTKSKDYKYIYKFLYTKYDLHEAMNWCFVSEDLIRSAKCSIHWRSE